jgi:TRAP-type transport system small permease protein
MVNDHDGGGERAALPLPVRMLISLDRASYAVIVAAMAGMSILVILQVFYRYALSSSIDAADELSRLFFVWAIFLAIPHGVRSGIHVGIDLLTMVLPSTAQSVLFRVGNVAGAVLMAVVGYMAFSVLIQKWPELMPTLPMTASLYYVPVLICTIHSFFHMILLAWKGPTLWRGDAL